MVKVPSLSFRGPSSGNLQQPQCEAWAFEFQAEGIVLGGLSTQKIVVTVLLLDFGPLSGQQTCPTLITSV